MTFVIVNEYTDELVACISDKSDNIIMKSGYDVVIYHETEPVFVEVNGRVYLEGNKFIINPYEVNE